MRTLWAASVRHLLQHPAQLALALLGLALGVATITAVDIAAASSRRAFELSMDAVNGAATHQIIGGPQGIDERIYVELRRRGRRIDFAPVVEGYVSVGARTMQLIGIDPFADPAFREPTIGRGAPQGAERAGAMSRWLTQPGTVVMAARTAAELGLAPDRSFEVRIGGQTYTATLLAQIEQEQAGYDSLLITDIAQAQEWLGMSGALSRIDVRVPESPDAGRLLAELRGSLPPGVALHEAQRRTEQSLDMTSAFTTNLQAMSLLALFVSVFLIYSAMSFAVVQRRRTFGTLRALGATRADVLKMVLIEAAVLGAVGAALGLLLGFVIGRELVTLVSRTINDLYFVVAVTRPALPTISIVKALVAGFAVAWIAAALPAIEVAGSPPQLGLRRSSLETRAVRLARWLIGASLLMALAAGAIVMLSGRSLNAAFVALFLLLVSVAAITPASLRALARGAARLAAGSSPVVRLAFGDIAASLSRTGVAVAALGVTVAAMIGVAVMVESFRESLHEWLGRTMRADIYVTAPGPGFARPERRLDPAVIDALLASEGVVDHSASRRVTVESPHGPIPLDALDLARESYAGLQLVAGEPERVWRAFGRGAIVISEPLAWRLELDAGDRLTLTTANGPQAFDIAGVYREYGNDRGNVLIDRATYRRLWRDDALTALGLYVAEGVRVENIVQSLRRVTSDEQTLFIRSNAELRDLSMRIFDRTFVITRVLYWITAGVAAIGIISALLAWELERARELALLRSLGLTPRGVAALIGAQTSFMGLAALLAALPAGLLTAMLLVEVINRRAFGWQIDLHVNAAQLADALVLSLTAALIGGLYPAWRAARAPIASGIREE